MDNKLLLDAMETMLHKMKQEKDEKYNAFYCHYMCVKTSLFREEIMHGINKSQAKIGWELRDYFIDVRLEDVYRYHGELPDEFSVDLIEEFTISKAGLYVDMSSYIEDELAGMRDIAFAGMESMDDYESYEDDMIPFEKKDIVNFMKGKVYTDILLEKYFTNKSGKTSLQTFIDDVFYYGSFYVALKNTRVRILKETVVSYYDIFCLCQLIERYISFGPEYREDYTDALYQILEYGLTQMRMQIYTGNISKKNKEGLIGIMIGRLIYTYESPLYTVDDNCYLELNTICLSVLSFSQKGCNYSLSLQEEGLKINNDNKKLCVGLFDAIFLNKPFLQEEGFYGKYQGRFTLEEYKQWRELTECIHDTDFVEARKILKKLRHHKQFFRYKFHDQLIDVKELGEVINDAIDDKNITSACEYFSRYTLMVNDLRELVVRVYPPKQINDVLLKLATLDYDTGKYNEILYNIPFNEKEFHDKLQGQINKLNGRIIGSQDVGRNDKCPCGSEKKFKKCCGRVG